MSNGYDPILLESRDVNEWISEGSDNFVIVLDKTPKKYILLKKSYFLNPQINDLYLQCDIKNDALMLNETNKSKLYRNIGYYFGKYTMIDDKELIRNLKKNKNIFKLKTNEPGSADIVPLDQWDKPESSFINQETLLLTQIGLFKSILKGDEKKKMNQLFKKNMPHKEEVYFNNLISNALTNYSWQWDGPINGYLRTGEDYWNSAIFIKYMNMKRYGNTKAESIKNVKARIESIDKCFMEYAPRNQNTTTLYYRGMKNGYGWENGSEVIVRNFTSISENIDVAYRFSDKIKRCCIHELTIDKGIPLINMVTTTKFKGEKEILLPRDLVFKLVGFKGVTMGNQSIRKLQVSKMRPDQFKLDTGCNIYPIVKIEPLKNLEKTPIVKESIKKEKLDKVETPILQLVPKNVEANLEPANPAKKPRCPKGYNRDKKTGLCLDKDGNIVQNPTDVKNKQVIPKTVKKKRCPNGQKRNKQTGLCEPK
tara:strand:+ start:1759 stop:3198 length:1440 start_codon:yes stop_codon:yes gene_type:complete